MFGFVQQCIDQYCQLAKVHEKDIPLYQTPSIEDHLLTLEDIVAKGKLHDDCSRNVLKILWCTRRARPDTYWAVNSLAREVSKWTVACDKRLLRLVGYFRWSKYHSLQMTVGNKPTDCVIMYFLMRNGPGPTYTEKDPASRSTPSRPTTTRYPEEKYKES